MSVEATPLVGQAPLRVAFAASGEAAAYHWDFGDGSSADGRTVEQTYAAGRWTATLTARSSNGEETVVSISVTAYGLTFVGPNPARYGRRAVFRGAIVPAERTFGARVRLKLDTRRLASYRIRVEIVPNEGYGGTVRVLRANVVLPRLVFGTRGVGVAQLGDQLRRLHYAAPYGAAFDGRMLDAVYAFEKVHGLPRTGVVDGRFWRALGNPQTPIPRYVQPASHLEVNKGRQVLYVVRNAHVALIVPISTAGVSGTYTPVGRFSLYRKVVGFDPSPLGTLYDPMYFTGGYAIHGNPSVPPYPASHGCVRVPMWVAPHLYATNPYGEAVYVY